ncbi:MAG: vitamin K epoxide reductase family protein [Nitrospinales bacterium]
MKKDNDEIFQKDSRLSFPIYFWTVAAIAIIGLFDTVYLSISHYRVHMDVGYMSFCAISKALNCDSVSQSKYSIFFNAPVAVWGVVGYAIFLTLLMFAKNQKPSGQRIWPLLLLIAGLYSFISIILALISSIYIKSYCLMCILVFSVNFLLFYFAWIVRKRFNASGFKNSLILEAQFWREKWSTGGLVIFSFLTISFLLVNYYPKYWDYSTVMTVDLETGITEDGHPWIGAVDPLYTITEFSDYQCFQCMKMHSFLRLIIARHPKKIRLIHRHFPMDHTINPIVKKPYHIGSGKMALVSIYSATKGKFWEMNDLLFKIARQKEPISTKTLLGEVGLDLPDNIKPEIEKNLLKILMNDIDYGINLGLVGTPGYLIDGKVYSGQIPPEIIRKISR